MVEGAVMGWDRIYGSDLSMCMIRAYQFIFGRISEISGINEIEVVSIGG